MHDSTLARDLVAKAADAAGGRRVRSLHLVAGALCGIGAAHLRSAVEAEALCRWDHVPRVEVTMGDDPTDPGAEGIMLTAVRV